MINWAAERDEMSCGCGSAPSGSVKARKEWLTVLPRCIDAEVEVL
jgi:hypothetical protein